MLGVCRNCVIYLNVSNENNLLIVEKTVEIVYNIPAYSSYHT